MQLRVKTRVGYGGVAGLLASTSVAALLIGGGTPAFACPARPILIQNTGSYSAGVSNPAGCTVSGGTAFNTWNAITIHNVDSFSGGITNSGTLSANVSGIYVSDLGTFSGGISNSGTLSASIGSGININEIATFIRGITNSGTISAGPHRHCGGQHRRK